MAITAQEHTDLKLGDVAIQLAQLQDQLESVHRILKDVERTGPGRSGLSPVATPCG